MGRPHLHLKFRRPFRVSGNCVAGRHASCYNLHCTCSCNHMPGPPSTDIAGRLTKFYTAEGPERTPAEVAISPSHVQAVLNIGKRNT